MPRVKVARKSTFIDMTAMCDVAFLLLTFFILTAKPRVDDPVKTDVPASTKITPIPEENLGLILIGGADKVFYSVTGSDVRVETLKEMGERYNIPFTPAEQLRFSNTEVFGVPMAQMKSFLAMDEDQKKAYQQPGIQYDTTNNNELSNWILTSRKAQLGLHGKLLDIAIKGDKKEQYPVVHTVIEILGKQKLFKFSLITDLKTAPKRGA